MSNMNNRNNELIATLKNFGEQSCEGKKDFFTSLVTESTSESKLTDFTLYFLAFQIPYEYRAINVEIQKQSLKIRFFTLATIQSEHYLVDISNSTLPFKNKLNEIGNLGLFKAALEFLVNQTLLKAESRNESILNQIIPGQARVAILTDGKKINVGWIRIEGEEVVYYTGQGLYNIWRPNMTKDEQIKAEGYKKLKEPELKQLGYLDKRRISEFKSIE
jgi:hypothetical protein